ncbi:hypothetical protein [Magnetospira sp. QH-2]|uniref:hypothetical protein n=1 Tax=Magnetospira sp. (strain QH-2) TaxID=1288970 RepID=UPI0011DC84B9|nr:hypothetical protein [Magnetospira sp. QH-2]
MTELLLWRFMRGHRRRYKFQHVVTGFSLPNEERDTSIFIIRGSFMGQEFAAEFGERSTDATHGWWVRNTPALLDWMTFQRLKTPEILPEIRRSARGTITEDHRFVHAGAMAYGVAIKYIPEFYQWMIDNLDPRFINFVLDHEQDTEGRDAIASYQFTNLHAKCFVSIRQRQIEGKWIYRLLLPVSADLATAFNLLLVARIKAQGIEIIGCSQDDRHLGTRCSPDLNDSLLTSEMNKLSHWIRQRAEEDLTVLQELLDWSPPPTPKFFPSKDTNVAPLPQPSIMNLVGDIFKGESIDGIINCEIMNI